MNTKKVFAGIDWFTGSKSYASLGVMPPQTAEQADAVALKILDENEHWNGLSVQPDLRPEPFYDWSYSDGNGLRLSLSRQLSQGVKVVLSGTDWSIGEAHSFKQWQAIRNQDWRPTRIDVAFDFVNFGYTAINIWEKGMKEQAYAGRRKSNFITSESGSSITLGARTSDKYLRMYEKGKEQGTNEDWFRVEIEIKGRTANAYNDHYEAILKHGANAILAITSRLPQEANDFLFEFAHGVQTPEVGRKQTRGDREKWILTQIVPILKEERSKNSPAWRAFLEAMQKP